MVTSEVAESVGKDDPKFLAGVLKLFGVLRKKPNGVWLAYAEDDCSVASTGSGHFIKHDGFRVGQDIEVVVAFAQTCGEALVKLVEGINPLRSTAPHAYGALAGALIKFSKDLSLPEEYTEALNIRARGEELTMAEAV